MNEPKASQDQQSLALLKTEIVNIPVYLYALVHDLQEAPRGESDRDVLEGIRYIMLPETLLQDIVEKLRRIADILAKNPSVLLAQSITPEQVERWKQWWEKETGGIFGRIIKRESGLD